MPDSNRYARQSFSPDGVNREYQVDVPYLQVTHLALTHNDATLAYGTDWELANPTTIRTTAVLTAGSETLVLTRSTDVAEPVAQFVSPGTFTFGNLNRIIKQLLYGVQEAFDRTVGGEEILAEAQAARITAEAAQVSAAASAAAAEDEAGAAAASAALAATFDPASYYTKSAADTLLAGKATSSHTHTAADVPAVWETGDYRISIRATTALSGWVKADDGTIGNASSGGTTRANADTTGLYALLWNTFDNTICPVSTGRGGSAAADFAANKTITLTKALGRALVVAGTGSGLTARALGDTAGAEEHTHTGTTAANTGNITTANNAGQNTAPGSHVHTFETDAGSSMQPSAFVSVFIKL